MLKAPIFAEGVQVLSEDPLEVALAPRDWHFGVMYPIVVGTVELERGDMVVARFRVGLCGGNVRVGCVDPSAALYIGDEIEVAPREERQDIQVAVPAGAGSIVFRTALATDSKPPLLQIERVEIVVGKQATSMSIVDVPCHAFAPSAGGILPPRSIVGVEMLISHSTRQFDHARASAEFLKERYARADRLKNLPPFESLVSASTAHSLHGALTHFRIGETNESVVLQAIRCIDSRELIQQAAVIGGKLVICSNGFLGVLPSVDHRLYGDEFDAASPFRIDDPWFAGLHTVVGIGSDEALLSAAGPDAVLWVDLGRKSVTRRFRLPEERYGANYALTESMSVSEHYIPNDYQLGHLNSACPDDDDGCYFTTLGQGDIGHVDRNGKFDLVASGYVGLHGLRRSLDGSYLYFSESPTGKLWKIENGATSIIASVATRWLHDSQELSDGIFACLAVDRNEIILLDVQKNLEVATFDLESRGLNPQFISVVTPAA